MVKKICISGYYGFDNFGDETILRILVENLKNFKISPQITVFSVNPEITSRKLNVNSVNTFGIKDVILSVFNCDYLISGGGSLLQDVTSKKSLLYYLFVILTAVFFRKKVIIFAQGIGPISNVLFRTLTLLLLKKSYFITVRDEASFKLLKDNGIDNVQKCFDPVWNVNIINNKISDKIGIQLREFPLVTNEFIIQLAKNINNYFFDKKIIILSLQNNIDLIVCEKLKSELIKINPNLKIDVIKNTDCQNIINIISELKTLVAMRYHACLIGIKSGINVLPINYDIKVKELAENFNLKYINSIENMDKTFEAFINTEIKYDENKIKNQKFDFEKFEEIFK